MDRLLMTAFWAKWKFVIGLAVVVLLGLVVYNYWTYREAYKAEVLKGQMKDQELKDIKQAYDQDKKTMDEKLSAMADKVASLESSNKQTTDVLKAALDALGKQRNLVAQTYQKESAAVAKKTEAIKTADAPQLVQDVAAETRTQPEAITVTAQGFVVPVETFRAIDTRLTLNHETEAQLKSCAANLALEQQAGLKRDAAVVKIQEQFSELLTADKQFREDTKAQLAAKDKAFEDYQEKSEKRIKGLEKDLARTHSFFGQLRVAIKPVLVVGGIMLGVGAALL